MRLVTIHQIMKSHHQSENEECRGGGSTMKLYESDALVDVIDLIRNSSIGELELKEEDDYDDEEEEE